GDAQGNGLGQETGGAQEHLPRAHEPRAPHPLQRHDRHAGPAAHHGPGRGAGRLRPHGLQVRRHHARHPRRRAARLQARVRQAHYGPRALQPV
ncbi:unnamed protein product, partial [Heterosigma akashiwo]